MYLLYHIMENKNILIIYCVLLYPPITQLLMACPIVIMIYGPSLRSMIYDLMTLHS